MVLVVLVAQEVQRERCMLEELSAETRWLSISIIYFRLTMSASRLTREASAVPVLMV
jgi:hypothetical protein